MKNLGDMLKQAQALQGKMQDMQARLAAMEIEGVAGGDLVKVTLNGKGELIAVRIDRSLMSPDERGVLEDLLLAAHRDARARVERASQEEMSKLTGGLPLPPGFSMPF